MYYLNSDIARRVSLDLVTCYDSGVKDGIAIAWPATDGTAPKNMTLGSIWDVVRMTPSGSAENVYIFASSDYDQTDTTGDESPVYEDRIYEQKIPNRRPKKRVLKADLVDFADDKLGKIQAKFHTAGTATIVNPYRALVYTLATGRDKGGTGSVILSGIDGQPFYGDHPIIPGRPLSAGKWFNDIIRPGGLTSGEGGTFEEMWDLMVSFPGEDGKPCGTRPTHLAVGVKDLWAGIDICTMDKPSGGAGGGNRSRGLVQLIYVPEWQNGEVALFDASNSLERAAVFQEREPNRLVPLFTDPNSPQVLSDGYMSWLLTGRWEAGIGHPRRVMRLRRK